MSQRPEDVYKINDIGMGEWMEVPTPATQYLLDPWIMSDAINLISGPPKKGRKTLTLQFGCLLMALGRSTEHMKTTGQYKTLYFQAEGSQREFKNRVGMFLRALDYPVETRLIELGGIPTWKHLFNECQHVRDQITQNLRIVYPARILISDDRWVATIMRWIENNGTDHVVLDSLTQMHGADENSAQEMHKVWRNINRIRDMGVAVTGVYHLNKAGNKNIQEVDMDDALRGSSATPGIYDNHDNFRKEMVGPIIVETRSREDEGRHFEAEWVYSKTSEGKIDYRGQSIIRLTDMDHLDPDVVYSKLAANFPYDRRYPWKKYYNTLQRWPMETVEEAKNNLINQGLLRSEENTYFVLKKREANGKAAGNS